jgi:ribosome maturation protein SDO1
MSRQITQPINQVRLTNVAIVRMQTHGKRFEVAAYRNKVVNFRQGVETDLDETLQTDRVFTNVSKGQFAKTSDLKKCFGTADEEEICRTILMKGQVQVSDMERSAQLEATTKEVASMMAAKCVDPHSNRPYTVSQIRDAMQRAEFCVHPTRSVKQQFLDCVKLIRSKDVLPLERAKMELCIVYDSSDCEEEAVVQALKDAGIVSKIDVKKESAGTTRLTFLADPSLFRAVQAMIAKKEFSRSGRLEILQQVVIDEGDVNFASEMERKNGISTSSKPATAAAILEEPDLPNLAQIAIADADEQEDEVNIFEDRPISARKSNKKAQKKSKKAKRREKEEAAERQTRIDAEKARQAERAERLGLDREASDIADTGGDGSDEARRACNTCGGSFSAAQYRAHFRSDWHKYNMKLKVSGAAPVNEQEFLACDADAFFD